MEGQSQSTECRRNNTKEIIFNIVKCILLYHERGKSFSLQIRRGGSVGTWVGIDAVD